MLLYYLKGAKTPLSQAYWLGRLDECDRLRRELKGYKKLRKASEMSQTESSIKIAFDSERTCFSHEYVGKS